MTVSSRFGHSIICVSSSRIPNLPAVEQILQHGIKGQINRCQRVKVMVGHPDAHSGIFLSEELSARYGVAIFVANPFAQAELDDAK